MIAREFAGLGCHPLDLPLDEFNDHLEGMAAFGSADTATAYLTRRKTDLGNDYGDRWQDPS